MENEGHTYAGPRVKCVLYQLTKERSDCSDEPHCSKRIGQSNSE